MSEKIPQRWAVARVHYRAVEKRFWMEEEDRLCFCASEAEAVGKAHAMVRADQVNPVLILAVHRMVEAKPVEFLETPASEAAEAKP